MAQHGGGVLPKFDGFAGYFCTQVVSHEKITNSTVHYRENF